MNTFKQLEELGIKVDKNINPDLLKLLVQLLPKPAKKKAVRPNNVREEKKDDNLLPAGKYIVSFAMQLRFGNSYKTKAISEEYDSNGADTKQEVLNELANKAIKETYFDGNMTYEDKEVSLEAIVKPRFNEHKEINIRQVKNKAAALQYKIFPDDALINKNKGECVLDFIMSQCYSATNYKKYTRNDLIADLKKVALKEEENFETEGVTTRHIIAWAKARENVTCYAIDPFFNVFASTVAKIGTKLMLVFVVNNNHVYPITDKAMKDHVSKTHKLDFNPMRFSVGDDESTYILYDEAIQQIADPPQKEKVIHVETDDLSELLYEAVKQTGYNPTAIVCNGAIITVFEHPKSNHIYVASADYLKRKETAEKSLKETNYIGFVWANQSWAELWRAWQEYEIGVIPPSHYSSDSLTIREYWPQSGYIAQTREVTNEEEKEIISFDITK